MGDMSGFLDVMETVDKSIDLKLGEIERVRERRLGSRRDTLRCIPDRRFGVPQSGTFGRGPVRGFGDTLRDRTRAVATV